MIRKSAKFTSRTTEYQYYRNGIQSYRICGICAICGKPKTIIPFFINFVLNIVLILNENILRLDLLAKYKQTIGNYVKVDAKHISLYWKGRVGLFAILQAMDISEGDELILPGYTCVVVPNAILYRGALPVYIDIDPTTFNMDPTKVEQAISPKTKAIIIQNTFGLSPDFDVLQDIAKRHDLFIIEDNTHGFGSAYKNQLAGTLGDAAFFSSQWNKPYSTGVGGFVIARDKALAQRLLALENTLEKPSTTKSSMLALQIRMRKIMDTTGLYWPAVKTYRWLSKRNIISGSSAGEELSGLQQPGDYWMGASKVQARAGIQELNLFEKNLKHRRQLANFYRSACQNLNLSPVFEPDYAQHIFLKYPFFVKDRSAFLELAAQHKIRLGEWLSSPIHPIEEDWEIWHYQKGTCPIAEKISQHLLNLPTDPDISLQEAGRIMEFLKDHREKLLANSKEALHFRRG